MKASLERLEALHEALIAALDASDLPAIESTSGELEAALTQLEGVGHWVADPELKRAAERVGRLAEAAAMRVNVLSDHAKRRAQALADLRGHGAPGLYGR